ncbi:hypothetical protein ABPG75_003273 [Micractinium tetrahymenae]
MAGSSRANKDYGLFSAVLRGSQDSSTDVHIVRDEQHGARPVEAARQAAALCLPAALASAAAASRDKLPSQLLQLFLGAAAYTTVLSATSRIVPAAQQERRLPVTAVSLTPAGAAKQQVTLHLEEGYQLGSKSTGTKVRTTLAGFGDGCQLNGQRKTVTVSADRLAVTYDAPSSMQRAALEGILAAVAGGRLRPAIVGWQDPVEGSSKPARAALVCELSTAKLPIRRLQQLGSAGQAALSVEVDEPEAAAARQQLWTLLGSLGQIVRPVGAGRNLDSTQERLRQLEAHAESTDVEVDGLVADVDSKFSLLVAGLGEQQVQLMGQQAAVEELGRRVGALELDRQRRAQQQQQQQQQQQRLERQDSQGAQPDADMADAANRKRARAEAGGQEQEQLLQPALVQASPSPASLQACSSLGQLGWLQQTQWLAATTAAVFPRCSREALLQSASLLAPHAQAGVLPPQQQQRQQQAVPSLLQAHLEPQQQEQQLAVPSVPHVHLAPQQLLQQQAQQAFDMPAVAAVAASSNGASAHGGSARSSGSGATVAQGLAAAIPGSSSGAGADQRGCGRPGRHPSRHASRGPAPWTCLPPHIAAAPFCWAAARHDSPCPARAPEPAQRLWLDSSS